MTCKIICGGKRGSHTLTCLWPLPQPPAHTGGVISKSQGPIPSSFHPDCYHCLSLVFPSL